jgi:hypothetical protein
VSLEDGMGKFELTEEQKRKLAKMKEDNEQQKSIPPEDQPHPRSDRFFGPIGADADGNIHTYLPDEKREEKR